MQVDSSPCDGLCRDGLTRRPQPAY